MKAKTFIQETFPGAYMIEERQVIYITYVKTSKHRNITRYHNYHNLIGNFFL